MAIVATRVPTRRRRAFACAAGAIVALGLAASRSDGAMVERVVAVVGDRALLLSDLEQRLRPRRLHVYRNIPDAASRAAALTQLRRELLQVMVDEVLEAQAAAHQGLAVSAGEIEHAVEVVRSTDELDTGGAKRQCPTLLVEQAFIGF